MSVRYADTSALVRCYLVDEDDHKRLRGLLLEGQEPAVTSEITRVELASAIGAAVRTLGAIHLAVAATTATALAAGESLEFVTCDQQQAQTADALGFVTP